MMLETIGLQEMHDFLQYGTFCSSLLASQISRLATDIKKNLKKNIKKKESFLNEWVNFKRY